MAIFQNRIEAGKVLAERLASFANRIDVIVLALPRGGVPVAFPVAEALNAPLDVFIVRKLGAPGHEELAMGAIATGGVRVLNQQVVDGLGIPEHVVDSVTAAEAMELARRERQYRDDRPPPRVQGKTVILIDDGLATGSSMHAAVRALREQGPAHIVVAVPAAPRETCDAFKSEVDEVICAITPEHFLGVGQWYQDFSQTTDAEVRELLERAEARHLTQLEDTNMATQEIPRSEWVRFFNDYSQQHEGWLATVQVMGGDVGNRTEAHSMPLHGVTYEEKGTGADSVNVFLSKGTHDDETRTITHPKHVRIDNQEGLDQGLEIEADDGTKTIIRFENPGSPPMVDRM